MKRLIALFTVLFCATTLFAASLRDYVCVVRPNISEKTTAFLKDYKDFLISKGYKNYANHIDGFLEGSFGSGFIIYASDGKPYILTNRHVISEADTANVQFENEDGSISEYKDLTIVASDEEIDIALIALPAGFKKPGLTLAATKVGDGEDVYSAGFPGLGGDPVWQLGKGIVSNSNARIKELLDPSISTIIQHSAQIDGGNSGGPLMVVNSKATAGYSVVGINTWKAVYRENTNFAIPASVIKKFMDKAVAKKSTVQIADRITEFNKTVSNKDATFSDMSRYISNEMVAVCGGDYFLKVLQKASTDIRSVIVNTFAYDPIEGLRFTLAYYVYSTFTKDKVTVDYTTGEPTLSGAAYKVVFSIVDGDGVPSFWVEEHGNWKLSDFDNLASGEDESAKNKKSKKNTKAGSTKENFGESLVTIDDPYNMSLYGGYVLPKDGSGGWLASFDYSMKYIGISLFAQSEKLDIDIYDVWGDYEETSENNLTTFGTGLRLQVPVSFTYVIVEPYATLNTGFTNFMDIGNHTNRLYLGYGAGLDVIIAAMSDTVAPYVGFKYVHSYYKDTNAPNNADKSKSNRFAVTLGVKFAVDVIYY